MTVADELEASRAALVMINPAPYNAEAPPDALVGDVTPTNLHYVRSNFAVPDHDGTLEIGGAVGNPMTLTIDDLRALPAHDHVVTLECAGNGRGFYEPSMPGLQWGHGGVGNGRWRGVRTSRFARAALARPWRSGWSCPMPPPALSSSGRWSCWWNACSPIRSGGAGRCGRCASRRAWRPATSPGRCCTPRPGRPGARARCRCR